MAEIPEKNSPEQKQEGASLPRVRTYKSDVAESLKAGGQSLTQMVIAEKNREERRGVDAPQIENRKFFTKNIVFVTGGTLLLFITFGIVAFLFLKNQKEDAEAPPVAAWSPIFTEIQKKIALRRIDGEEIARGIETVKKETSIPINAVVHILPTKSVQYESGARDTHITTGELFSVFPNDIPPQLLRTLDASFFLGLHSFRTIAPVLILKNRFYDGAFLGMLEWERFMLHDIAPLFLTSSSAGQTTFEDMTIKNIDARVLKNERGEIALLYSFINREVILITTDRDTFEEIVTRFQTPRPAVR